MGCVRKKIKKIKKTNENFTNEKPEMIDRDEVFSGYRFGENQNNIMRPAGVYKMWIRTEGTKRP